MRYLLPLLSFLAPLLVSAAQAPTDFKSFLGIFTGIIDILVPFIFALTFLTIMWGVIKAWVIGGGATESVEKGKSIAIVGVIGFVIMLSIWGILNLLRTSIFGI
jgi:hypothetical protein